MKNKILISATSALFLIATGCVSINSEKYADRLAALKAITDEEDLFAAIEETRFSDVRNLASARIRREDLSLRLLKRNDLSDSVRIALVGNVDDQGELKKLALDQQLPTEGREAALERVKDEAFLGTFVEDRGQDDQLRRTALVGIESRAVNKKLLGCRPSLETWVWEHAIPRVSDQVVLSDAVASREAEKSVRKMALDRIEDGSQFLKLLHVDPPLEDWIREKAISRVSDQPTLIALFRDKNSNVSIRELALKRIENETELLHVVKDRSDIDGLRRKALDAIQDESSAIDILDTSPVLENWVCSRAVSLISNQEKLGEVFLDPRFDDEVRLSAGAKVASPGKMKDLFLASVDDLAASISLGRMDEADIKSKECQRRLLTLFRSTSDSILMIEAWKHLSPKTDFCRKGDQRRIVSMLKAVADVATADRMLENLFDDDCILELASGNNERLAEAAIRLRPSPATALQIAERSPFPSIQCAALSFLEGEKDFAQIAKTGPSRAVRVAAIARLSSSSTVLLSELAEESDSVLAETAVRKLKMIAPGDAVADIERKAEASRKAEEERVKAELKAREERERRAEQELEEQELRILADAQIHSFRHYLEVLERHPDIGARTFRFSGRVVRADGRLLVLSVPHTGGGAFALEVKLLNKPAKRLAEKEVLTVSGRYRNGTRQSAELDKGTIICFGTPSGPSAEVEKRIRNRRAVQSIAEPQIRAFRQYLARREENSRTKKETFQFTGVVAGIKYRGRELSLSIPIDDGETFTVDIELSGKPNFNVEYGAVLTVSGRYENGTKQSAELDKGTIIGVGVSQETVQKD